MTWRTAEAALSHIIPGMDKNYILVFSGGEPLLNFSLIQKIVRNAHQLSLFFQKKPTFSLTTNGSLLNPTTLDFLQKHSFHIMLSFDVFAQNVQRQPATFRMLMQKLRDIQSRKLSLEINSVFSPDSIALISSSIAYLLKNNVNRINLSLDQTKVWSRRHLTHLNQAMLDIKTMLVKYYQKNRSVPLTNFTLSQTGMFTCTAGIDRIAVSPDGTFWGCALFPDISEHAPSKSDFPLFRFGSNDLFDSISKAKGFRSLSVDHMRSGDRFCFLCPYLNDCEICPANAVLAGGEFREVPAHMCRIQQIKAQAVRAFRSEIRSMQKNVNH